MKFIVEKSEISNEWHKKCHNEICGPHFSHSHIPFEFTSGTKISWAWFLALTHHTIIMLQILLIELEWAEECDCESSARTVVVIDSVRTQQIFLFESHLTSPFVRLSVCSGRCEFTEKMKIIFLPSSPSPISLLACLPLPAITLREFRTPQKKSMKRIRKLKFFFLPLTFVEILFFLLSSDATFIHFSLSSSFFVTRRRAENVHWVSACSLVEIFFFRLVYIFHYLNFQLVPSPFLLFSTHW